MAFDYKTGTFGPESPWMDVVLNTDASGAPNLDTSDPRNNMPMVPLAKSTVTGTAFNQQPQQQPQNYGLGQPPVPQPQGDMTTLPDQQGGLNYPKVPQQYNLPARTDIPQITGYKSAFDRFPELTNYLQHPDTIGADSSGPQTPWDNQGLPPWLRALSYGVASPQQREDYGKFSDQADADRLKKMKAIGDLMQAAAGASADDQQGLERNTAAYKNVAGAYNEMNTAPHIQHSIDMQAMQRADSGTAALDRGGLSNARALQVQNMTPYLQDTQLSVQGKNDAENFAAGKRGGLSGARAEAIPLITNADVSLKGAQAGEAKARTTGINAKTAKIASGDLDAQYKAANQEYLTNLRAYNIMAQKGVAPDESLAVRVNRSRDARNAIQDKLDAVAATSGKADLPEVPIEDGSDGKLIQVKTEAPPMPADPKELKVGQSYTNKNGKLGKYKGNGQWQLLQ